MYRWLTTLTLGIVSDNIKNLSDDARTFMKNVLQNFGRNRYKKAVQIILVESTVVH